jgi:hypothetical protein
LADPIQGALGEPPPENGPGSSSYELSAITEDFTQPRFDADARDVWTDDAVPSDDLEHGDGRIDRAMGRSVKAGQSWDSSVHPRGAREMAEREPWYSRVLQVWGIIFLVWAAVIVGRSVLVHWDPDSATTNRADPVPSVVSVLLLVPGAAGLFLLVDLGRYIRGLQPSFPSRDRTKSSFGKPALLWFWANRPWGRLFPTSPSARP